MLYNLSVRQGFIPLFIIVAIIFLLGSSGVAYVVLHKNKPLLETASVESTQPTYSPQSTSSPEQIKEKPQQSASTQPSPAYKPSQDPTTGWDSWTSLYYVVKYPTDWSINFCTTEYANIDYEWQTTRCKYPYEPTKVYSAVNLYFNNSNFHQYYDNEISKQPSDKSLLNLKQTNTSVNGFPATRSSFKTDDGTKFIKYYINWTERLFTITYRQDPNRQDKEADFENIVSSFKLK